jgi:hypothetical protein
MKARVGGANCAGFFGIPRRIHGHDRYARSRMAEFPLAEMEELDLP